MLFLDPIDFYYMNNFFFEQNSFFRISSFVSSPVHTKNDNYKDNDISVHTSERYRLFILSARSSAALNSVLGVNRPLDNTFIFYNILIIKQYIYIILHFLSITLPSLEITILLFPDICTFSKTIALACETTEITNIHKQKDNRKWFCSTELQ